jgi:hypothetical protein
MGGALYKPGVVVQELALGPIQFNGYVSAAIQVSTHTPADTNRERRLLSVVHCKPDAAARVSQRA